MAARLAELTLGEPARVPDMAGPQVLSFADLVRGYLRASGRRRPVLPLWLPGLRKILDAALVPEPRRTPYRLADLGGLPGRPAELTARGGPSYRIKC